MNSLQYFQELGGHDDEEKDSGNQMAAVATKARG